MNFLVNTIHIFSANIRIELGIKKCGVMYPKRSKIQSLAGIKLLTRELNKLERKYTNILVERNHAEGRERTEDGIFLKIEVGVELIIH